MAKEFKCPSCQTVTSRTARRCSNADCRAELGLCSHCKDVTVVSAGNGARLVRTKLECTKCGEAVVRCRTTILGGACNGLARASGRYAHQFCDECSSRGFDFATRVGVLALGTAAGALLRRPPRK